MFSCQSLKVQWSSKGTAVPEDVAIPRDFTPDIVAIYKKTNDDYKSGPIKHYNEALDIRHLVGLEWSEVQSDAAAAPSTALGAAAAGDGAAASPSAAVSAPAAVQRNPERSTSLEEPYTYDLSK